MKNIGWKCYKLGEQKEFRIYSKLSSDISLLMI